MNATIYLKDKGFSNFSEILDTFELPIKNKEFNKRIDDWKWHKFELDKDYDTDYEIEIKSADLFGKITSFNFQNINTIFYLYNVIKEHNLLNDFNIYWKYQDSGNIKELSSGEFFKVVTEILCTAYPDHIDEISFNEFNNNKDFLKKIPGMEEYVYVRKNDICEFLEKKTGVEWRYIDPAIEHWGRGYTDEKIYFSPDTYISLKNVNEEESIEKYRIETINNIFKVYVETKFSNKIEKVKDNKDISFYVAPNGFSGILFSAIAYSWDEVFSFIERVTDFENSNWNSTSIKDPLDIEVEKITAELQKNVDKKLKNFFTKADVDV